MPDDALPRTNGGNGQIRAHYDAYVTKADNSSYRHSERKTYFDVSGATIVRALGGKWHGKSGKTYCPAHDDDNASLQVDEKDGKTLVWCGGGCSQDEVLAALIDLGLWHNGEHQEPATHHESNGGAKPSPIIPVPHGAPAMSFKHPEWGKPAAVWAYHEIDGSLVGYVARFNTRNRNGDPDKTFLPITYCDLGEGKRGWRSKGIPEPQPLYRLLKVVVRTNVPILVTEGEKAADSAQRLFPDYAVVTAMRGAKSPDKSDWSPVSGRQVVIWPDADEPGRKFAESVARLAGAAGALGQVRGVLEILVWESSLEGFALKPVRASYS